MKGSEQLREALLDLERSRSREHQLRVESDALLEGLRALTLPGGPEEVLARFLTVLQALLAAENTFLLTEDGYGHYTATASTGNAFLGSHWRCGALFRRVTGGTPAAVFDVEEVPEWRSQPEGVRSLCRSALHVPLTSLGKAAVLVFTHADRGFFSAKHLQLARRFAPLASQALASVELQKSILERDRFFALSLEVMCILDAEFHLKQTNDGWGQVLGYGPGDLASKGFGDFLHPEDSVACAHSMAVLAAEGGTVGFECRMSHKDGSSRRFAWRVAAIPGEGLYYAVARDVTQERQAVGELTAYRDRLERLVENRTTELIAINERLRQEVAHSLKAEQAAVESEERYRRLVELSPDAIAVHSKGRLVFVNPACVRMLGAKTSEELLGRPVLDCVHPDYREAVKQRVGVMLGDGSRVPVLEEKFLKLDGTPFDVEVAAGPFLVGGEPAVLVAFRDITERKRMEALIRSSEEKYRTVIENSSEAILVAQDGYLRYANPSLLQISGYTREALFAKPFFEFLHPDDREMVIDHHVRRLQGDDVPPTYTFRLIKADGEVIWVENSGVLITWEDRPASLNFLINVTERRRAEEALKVAEEKYRGIFESAMEGVFQTSPEGRFMAANPALARILGYDSVEDLLSSVADVGVQVYADPATRKEFKDRVLREGAVQGFEIQFTRRDGSKVWVSLSAFAVLDDEGRLDHFGGFVVDITARKAAEDALRDEQRLFAGGPLVAFKWKAVEGWPIEYVSPNVEAQFGYRVEELAGQNGLPFAPIVHPEDIERVAREISSYSEVGVPSFEQEYRIRRSDGSYRWLYVFTTVLRDAQGTITHYQGYVLDITERRRIEAELLESERRLKTVIDDSPVPQFVIGRDHRVLFWNKAVEECTGIEAAEMIGTTDHWKAFYPEKRPCMVDLLVDGNASAMGEWYPGKFGASKLVEGAYEGVDFFPGLGEGGKWLFFTAAAIQDSQGNTIGALETIEDVSERKRSELVQNALHRISEAAHAAEDLSALCPRIHEIVGELMPARNLYIALCDQEGSEVSFPYFVDQQDPPPRPRKLGRGLTEHVLLTGEPLLATPEVFAEMVREGKIDAVGTPPMDWLGVPLRVRDRTIGVLVVQSYTGGARYAEKDKVLLQFVSHQVAAAIERTRADQELRQSETRFRTLTETTPVGIVIIRGDKIVYANPATEAISAWNPRENPPNEFKVYVHPEDRPRVEEHVRTVMSQERASAEFEFRFLSRFGQVRWVYASVGRMILARGPSLVVTFFDVTMRRTTEEEMHRIRQYLKSIIDSMPSVLVGVDLEGRVTEWNLQAERLTGISSYLAKGKALRTVYPWLAAQMELVQRSIQRGTPQKAEKIVHDVNGEKRYADVIVYPLTSAGAEGAVVRVDDVTDRVKMEQMMAQTEKIMALGGIAAGVAHEINNPLGGILQGAQNIVRRFSPDLPRNIDTAVECGCDLPTIRAYLEKREIFQLLEGIQVSGERAAKIVSDMLQFSRPSKFKVMPTDLAASLDKMVSLASTDYDLKKRYDFRTIEIVRDYDPDLREVPCIATQLELVFLNLLKNAAQAMHEARAKGSAAPPRITLRTRVDGDMARIEVEDTGPGIDEEARQRLFEPFFTTKEPGSGTGLGLSVSYFIVADLHKGELTVDSSPGRGATFIVKIPLVRKEAEPI